MTAESPAKCLPINLDELAYALHDSDQISTAHYLDLNTGEIIMLTEEMRAEAESINESIKADAENYDAAFEEALAQSTQPGWMMDGIRLASAVEAGYGTRYVAVPPVDSHEAYEDMADFIATVTNRRIQEWLAEAIVGRRPFRRFKDALLNYSHPTHCQASYPLSACREHT